MKPTLQFRQTQTLALTPQLQQSIRLLQLSTLELQQEIDQFVAHNPLLERIDDPHEAYQRMSADGSVQPDLPRYDLPATASHSGPDAMRHGQDGLGGLNPQDRHGAGPDVPGPSDGPGGDADYSGAEYSEAAYAGAPDDEGRGDGLLWSGTGARTDDDDDDDRGRDIGGGHEPRLIEHLLQQLAGARCSARDRVLVRLLIEELDDDGYLRTPLEEILQSLPKEAEVEPVELSAALKLLQSFDPAGVAGRSLQECLRLQLPSTTVRLQLSNAVEALAQRIIDQHLELLASRDYTKLRKLLRCDDDALRDAQQLIRALDPRPGGRFGGGQANFVIPDVVVRRTRQGWRAFLNDGIVPRLRVNDEYARIMKAQRGRRSATENPAREELSGQIAGSGASADTVAPEPGEVQPSATLSDPYAGQPSDSSAEAVASSAETPVSSNPLASQLQEARWLVKNVQQRFDTILRVAQEIVDRQSAFFSHGEVAMRPLVLREIAEAVGLHESTISRVTTQKFMLTPFGTVELKYFFGSHVATDAGGAASSTAIRALLRQLVDQEEPTDPLSDNRIAELLAEQGFVVARRTVAKYRELLRIPPVSQRKAL